MDSTSLPTVHPISASPSTRGRGWLRYALQLALVTVSYFALGQLSALFDFRQIDVSPAWLPAGIALAAVLLRGPVLLPGVFLGALTDELTRSALPVAIGIALAASLAVAVGASLLRRGFNFDPALSRPRHVVLLIAVGAAVTPFISGVGRIAVLTLIGGAGLQEAASAAALWTSGNALGTLLLATLILAWATRAQAQSAAASGRLLTALGVLQALISGAVFLLPYDAGMPVIAFATLPLAVALSVFLPLRWVAVMNCVMFGVTTAAVVLDTGPFSIGTADQRTLALMVYNLVTCITTLVIAALTLERQRIAAELGNSLERFQSLTALSADWMWEQDKDLRFTYFSFGAPDKAGVDPWRSIGKTRFEIPFEWESEQIKQEHAEDLAARRPFRDLTLKRVDDDGRLRYINVSGEPIYAPNGGFRGYRGVAHDITAMAQAAEDVRESAARFRSLVELSNDWYWETDEALRFNYLSDGFEQISGFVASDLLGKSSLELRDAWLSKEQRSEHEQVLRERRPFRNLVRRRATHDGQWRYASVSGEPVLGHSGEFRGYRGVGRDITRQWLAEEAVREASERFRGLVELSNDWYWEQDEALRFTRIEGAAKQGLVLGFDQFIGRFRWDFPFVNMSHADWEAHRQLLLEHRSFHDLELIARDDAGELFHLMVSGRPVLDADGRFRGYRGTTRNVTQARRAEHKTQRLSASFATLSEANHAIIHCRSDETLYRELCRIAVEHGRFTYCRICAMDGVSGQIQTRAEAGVDGGGLCSVGASIEPDAGAGTARSVLDTGERVVVNDILTDPRTASWREILKASAIGSMGTFPLRRGNSVIGALHLYAGQPNFFDEDLLALLEKLVLNISFALDNLDREFARREAEAALRQSETRFRDFTDAAAEYAWETDLGGYISFISGRVEMISGYCAAELTGRQPRDFMPPGEPERVEQWLESNRAADGSFRDLEYQVVARSGEIRWLRLNGVAILSEDGQVMGWRGTGADVTDRRATNARITYLATRDPLTELPNRVLLGDRLLTAIASAQRNAHVLALMFVDLDRFKTINDSLGHEVGDLVLKAAAGRLVECLRKEDTLARLGGDEFVVLLKDLRHAEDAAHVAVKVLAALSQPFEIAGHTLITSCSIGISIYPDDAGDERALMKNSDIAMYHAKERGRNNYQFFSPAMNTRAVERLTLETALRHALEREEFVLHYQPQVDIRTGRIVGVEALIRWQHPTLGLVPPNQFIPLAEETGLIDQMGEWALLTACCQVREWAQLGLPALKVAVNISARQLLRPAEFAHKVLNIIEKAGIDSALVELEMTESLLLQNADENISVLKELGRHHIRIAVDDFGTGYSSLSYLKQLPIDTLKIDRSFTSNLPDDKEGLAIVRAIVSMAHSLGLRVTAEGVETDEQLAVLRRMRCDEYQGFLFSKGLPAEPMLALLRAQPIAARRARRRAIIPLE